MMYYEIGQYLSKKVNAGEYGEGVISKIANKIKEQYPTLNGFSKRNLYQMIQFYEIYKDNQKVRTLSAQLIWRNILLIIQDNLHRRSVIRHTFQFNPYTKDFISNCQL